MHAGEEKPMGSRQKARAFLTASDIPDFYASIIEFTLTYFTTKAEKEGNESFAQELKKAREGYREDFEKAVEIVEEVYSEEFNDEELDELTVIHTTPASRKIREHTPGIMKSILEKIALKQE